VRFPAGTRVADIPGFEAGDLWVQDAAAALPARLLAAQAHERIVDLCAAPGGKTAQLAAAGAVVTAVERDPARIERLTANLKRWNLPAEVINADATAWTPPALFDAVLLDAPCSATGTIRRHPDVARVKRQRDVQTVTVAQHHASPPSPPGPACGLIRSRRRNWRRCPRPEPGRDSCAPTRGCGTRAVGWTGFSPRG
jgi:16S rRNA (cytosine967-C5)-methyltransferase